VHRRRATLRVRTLWRVLAPLCLALGVLPSVTRALPTSWTQLFLATFSGVPDTPATGTTFPADVGKLNIIVPSGQKISDIAPKSGIYSQRLVLSDLGAAGNSEFGIQMVPTADALYGAIWSFDLRVDSDCAFGGDVSDGATTDMLCFEEASGGGVTVQGVALSTKLKVGTNYHVDVGLYPSSDKGDYWTFCLTDVDGGTQETVTGLISGGYRAAHAAGLKKHAGKTGAISVASPSLLGAQN
jgi:hypothetical protein